MKTLIFLILTSLTFGQGMIVIDSSLVNSVKGRYGIYSEIQPVQTFDGKFIVPTACLSDKDLTTAKAKLLQAQSAILTIKNLPAVGQTVYKDSLYQSVDGIVKCRQTHSMTIYAPHEVPNLFSFYRENSDTLQWIPNEQVQVGWKRIYNSVTYICLQAHQTLSTWTPPQTLGVLWQTEAPQTNEWTVGVLYHVGDEVTYQGHTYRCRQQHTSISTWTPPAVPALWLLLQ